MADRVKDGYERYRSAANIAMLDPDVSDPVEAFQARYGLDEQERRDLDVVAQHVAKRMVGVVEEMGETERFCRESCALAGAFIGMEIFHYEIKVAFQLGARAAGATEQEASDLWFESDGP